MNDFMTIREASEKWGIGIRRINTLCNDGRIAGCIRFGSVWAIPTTAQKPSDMRVKTGKYIKSKEGQNYAR